MSGPLVSIIIPTFNRAHLIGETLDSVIAQTYQNWECIVVDDGSTDDTAKVMEAYMAKDSRIQYHHRPPEHKPGGNGARNYGFKMSKGEFIQWFDSDDIMFQEFLEKKSEMFIREPDIDVVFSAYKYFQEAADFDRISNLYFKGSILSEITFGSITCSPLSYSVKKTFLINKNFDENLYRSQDLDFFFRLFSENPDIKIAHVPEPLFKVRKHDENISGVPDKEGLRLLSAFIVHQRIVDFYRKEENKKGIEIHKASCLRNLKRLLINKNYKLVFIHTWKFSDINFFEKVKLTFSIIAYSIFGRGAEMFSKID